LPVGEVDGLEGAVFAGGVLHHFGPPGDGDFDGEILAGAAGRMIAKMACIPALKAI
jgi:hypothetical protein